MSSSILNSASNFMMPGLSGSSALGNFGDFGLGFTQNFNKFMNMVDMFDTDPVVTLKDGNAQTSTQGRIIQDLFGNVRVSGNIIWMSDVKKIVQKGEPYITKNGLQAGQSTTKYRSSFAIALCKGIVDEVVNIYADDVLINKAAYKIEYFYGTEVQQKSSVMSAFLGHENVPCFNNLCYLVFDDFPMENFSNRLPNFTFHVYKNPLKKATTVNNIVSCVNIIPGSGEFVYDTTIQKKLNGVWFHGEFIETSKADYVNYANNKEESNAVVAVDLLKKDFEKIKWTSVVCTWFASSLDAKNCEIYPACEFKNMVTKPSDWNVAGVTREDARETCRDVNGNPAYGGTPSDDSILRFVEHLRLKGLKICFYPMLMVDDIKKPWRGDLSCDIADVNGFFNKTNGYNEFILHYATLLKGKVDAFIIGSEMKGLTKLKDVNNNFIAVNEFCELAKKVREILGNEVKLTYAANWDEYHHTDGGWFNLDKLWADKNIDIIGIDAYFPLSNSSKSIYDVNEIINGWTSGEGYDLYYEDGQKISVKPLSADYAWKNLEHFWKSEHWNPNGQKTSWIPKSKKIWFTEYGFASVDCCSNQPNVFYSSSTVGSGFPIHSSGIVDFKAQATAIIGTEKKWENSEFVENKFLWAYDARPYPFFPAFSEFWSDAPDWKYGHWINGKFNNNLLSEIISYLMKEANFDDLEFNTSFLEDVFINGFLIDKRKTFFEIIKYLSQVYSFDIYFEDGVLYFKSFSKSFNIIEVLETDVVLDDNLIGVKKNVQGPLSLYGSINFLFLDSNNYDKISNVLFKDDNSTSFNQYDFECGISMTKNDAIKIASNMLYVMKAKSVSYSFVLKKEQCDGLKTLDNVRIFSENGKLVYDVRVESIEFDDVGFCTINGYENDFNLNDNSSTKNIVKSDISTNINEVEIVCIEPFAIDEKNNDKIRVYFYGYTYDKSFQNISIYYSDDNEMNYKYATFLEKECTYGKILNTSVEPTYPILDNKNYIDVYIFENKENLQSTEISEFFMAKNIGLFGNELIEFNNVSEVGNNVFRFSGLIRKRYGIDKSFAVNDKFILIDESSSFFDFNKNLYGKKIFIKAVPSGVSVDSVKSKNTTLNGNNVIDKVFDVQQFNVGHDIFVYFKKISGDLSDFYSNESSNKFFLLIKNNGNVVRSVPEADSYFVYQKEYQEIDFDAYIEKIDDFEIFKSF